MKKVILTAVFALPMMFLVSCGAATQDEAPDQSTTKQVGKDITEAAEKAGEGAAKEAEEAK
ncbi:MAG: hypothetical protein MK193_13485 [Lentisphaeria bacterium]|nr:hypothetical protein [Lentisphaeria bacterium]